MRRKTILSIAVVVSVVLYLALVKLKNGRSATVDSGPFSVETVETLRQLGTQFVEAQRMTVVRNSAGATRTELRQVIGLRLHEIKIRTPDRISIVEYPAVNLKRTVRISPEDYAAELTAKSDPAKSCASSIAGGDPPALAPSAITTEVIGGLQTYKLTYSRTGLTSWRAPALACAEVQRRQFYADNQSTSNVDLVAFHFGEPAAVLFQPNPESTEATPLQMLNAWIAFKGLDKDPAWAHQLSLSQKFYQRAEDYYHAHRP